MAITRPTKAKSPETFIAEAPDAGRKGVMRGRREQISITLKPELLAELDTLAARMGQSRAATIGLAIYRLLQSERR
jgi:hypothetical protein